MELWVIKADTMTNVTPIIGTVRWRSNVDELGDELNFNVAFNDARFFPKNPIEIGNLMVLKGKEELFRGIVIDEVKRGRSDLNYVSFDYAFYLNKSKGFYQFKERADNAIKKLCGYFNVPIGNIASMPTIIKKIYPNETISEIIKDIMLQVHNATGIKYLMEMRNGKLYIEKQQDLLIQANFKLASNIALNDVTHAISEPSRRRSIENMKNSIQIVSNNKLLATIKNDALINQYGLLQDIVQDDDVAKARTTASNMLKEFGKILEENSLTMIGDEKVRAGRIMEINEPVTGMVGKFLIKSAEHIKHGEIHTMNIDLGVL